MLVIWRIIFGMVILLSLPEITQAAATCASSQEDAEYVCSTHLLRQNCSCIEIHSAAKQCFAYGKQAYQCSWN
jgi:hypothetical protein